MAERVFAMPDLGEGLEEGKIVQWLVAEGDPIELNQPLVEVETAKAAVEIPSPFAGRVLALHGATGEDVAVGSPLATFAVTGGTAGGAADVTPPAGAGLTPPAGAGAAVRPQAGSGVAATPPVRKLAKELGVDLSAFSGSGPSGRITEADVRTAAAGTATDLVEISATRRTIAVNLERQAAIPQVTTFRTVDCAELEALRRELGVSPLPVVIAALCRTIADHPMLNASWSDAGIRVPTEVHVGLAADTERGLLVPVLRDAHDKGIAEIAAEIGRLAEAARAGTLTPAELSGATVAVSNTGSYGSEAGTPILSPGTGVTLAFGVIAPRALVVGDAVVARPAATISLTFDHRVLDGAAVGRALTALVGLLQSTDRLRDLPR